MKGTVGKGILIVAIGMFLAAGIPYVASTTLHADPGPGSDCKGPCGKKSDCGHGEKCGCGGHQGKCDGKCDGKPCRKGGQMPCRQMGERPPMREAMGTRMEEMRGTIAKLRALEAKMAALASKDDAAFRAASLEHSKLLTDLQDSHLKRMEGMMGGK